MLAITIASIFYINIIIASTANTERHAPQATVSKPLPKYASISAAPRPTAAESTLLVAYKIAGKVIAARTAYGV